MRYEINLKTKKTTEHPDAPLPVYTQAELEAKEVYDSLQYQRDRALEYPPIAEQLDDIYHNGIDAWKLTIKAIKDKYPKE